MATPFRRTLRSLSADDFKRWWLMIVPVSGLLMLWLIWFLVAPVNVWVVSHKARLEVESDAHVIEAPVAGRMVTQHVELGQEVAQGTPLFDLDAGETELRLVEAKARLAALTQQVERLKEQVASARKAMTDAGRASGAAAVGSRARYLEARAMADQATSEAARAKTLFDGGNISRAEYERAQSEAAQLSAAASAMRAEGARAGFDLQSGQSDREVRFTEVLTRQAEAEGQLAGQQAIVSRLELDVAARQILAPVAGRVAELTEVQSGSMVERGERLGVVVPVDGALDVVADFAAWEAMGRVRPGQRARVRLDGFPWTRYGSLYAEVKRVAEEPRDGQVRAELDLVTDNPRIPLQHGLPGTVEVQVERVSPASLVLRNAGVWFLSGRK